MTRTLIFELVPVVDGEHTPAHHVGTLQEPVGVYRSIAMAHRLMGNRPEIEHVRVHTTHPDRGEPRYLGMVTRDERRIVR